MLHVHRFNPFIKSLRNLTLTIISLFLPLQHPPEVRVPSPERHSVNQPPPKPERSQDTQITSSSSNSSPSANNTLTKPDTSAAAPPPPPPQPPSTGTGSISRGGMIRGFPKPPLHHPGGYGHHHHPHHGPHHHRHRHMLYAGAPGDRGHHFPSRSSPHHQPSISYHPGNGAPGEKSNNPRLTQVDLEVRISSPPK